MKLSTIMRDPIKYLTHIFRKKSNPRLLLLQQMPKSAVCAEIGVWKGDFSELILTMTSPVKLHLVDPWEFQSEFSERMYGGSVAKNQEDMDLIYDNVKKRLEKYPAIVVNKGKSEIIIPEFDDGYFDWVYIDGNHYYEYVLKDLQNCFPKVKSGGIIAGDDFTWGEEYGFPVKKAVQEFIHSKSLEDSFTVIGSQFIIKL